jgi:hypothetical protein
MALFVLQLYNAGRVLFGEAMAGILGAAVAVLHADPGRLIGLGPGAFNSYLSTGLYGSPTTVCGFILLASLTISLSEVLEGSSLRPHSLVTLVPFGLAAAATKVSVVPPILGGLGLVVLLAIIIDRRGPGRAAFAAALTLGLTALPFVWSLTAGDSSYRTILRWGPGDVAWSSPFVVKVNQALVRIGVSSGALPGDLPLLMLLLVLAAWAVGYFSLGGAGAAAFLWLRRPPYSPSLVWVLGVAGCGAAIGLLLQGQGLSQLFFLYDGQALLALVAGAGLVSAWRVRRRHPWLLGVLLGFSLPSLHMAGVGIPGALARDLETRKRTLSSVESDYAAGLAWLRAHATQDTVIFADNPSFLLSAFGECPTFYESGLFTPEGWRKRWDSTGDPYPQKVLLQQRFLRQPSRESAAAAARLLPPGTLLRVVADNVQSHITQGTLDVQLGGVPGRVLFPPDLFRLEFANAAMQIYRLEAPP